MSLLRLGTIAHVILWDFVYCHSMQVYPYLAEALAEVIEALRTERGMTKSSLAERASLERRYLREIEQRLKRPTVNAVYAICDALEVPPEDFFQRVSREIEKKKRSRSLCAQTSLRTGQ
ncbi:helix-turn-helix transcriptional regulator [uncultured Desulfovibrio sp.]